MSKLFVKTEIYEALDSDASTDDYMIVTKSYNGIEIFSERIAGNLGYLLDEIEVDFNVKAGDIVYAVVVQYSTGSTFDQTSGMICIVDIFDNAIEAVSLKQKILSGGKTDKSYIWTGYFERLENCFVETEMVKA